MQQLTLNIAPAPRPSLRNFVTGENAQLLAALQASLDGSGDYSRLCLWGGPGSGKSHLLTACSTAGGGSFHACGGGSADEAALSAGGSGLLALDDADRLDAAGQIALFNLINRRDAHRESAPLLLSCSQPPAASGLRADLATRLAQGLVLEVVALSDADKAAALTRHAAERGMHLPGEVVHYLLTHGARDFAALTTVLDALDELSLQMHRPITVPLLRQVLHAPHEPGNRN